ncbi:MAG: hypothetical protein AABY15_08525 [Nanoarchaeota archaeon]
MTKKDYQLIASVLSKAKTSLYEQAKEARELREMVAIIGKIESLFIQALKAENPKFDSKKFIEACRRK